MARDLVLFDFDGTLTDVSGFSHLIPDWDAFHEAALNAPPSPRIVEFARKMTTVAKVVVITGKPRFYQPAVIEWLWEQDIEAETVLMRPNGSDMSDADLKIELMVREFGPDWKDRVLFAVEDRDKMVDGWRKEGVTCLQCAASLY